jgi:hypothetical protein
MLLLIKICIINLLVKNYIINLLIKICMRIIQSRNIIAGKNLHSKITGKNLHDQLFIKTSINIFIYRQHINILGGKTWNILYLFFTVLHFYCFTCVTLLLYSMTHLYLYYYIKQLRIEGSICCHGIFLLYPFYLSIRWIIYIFDWSNIYNRVHWSLLSLRFFPIYTIIFKI